MHIFQTNLVKTISGELDGDFSDREQVWTDFLTIINSLPGVTVLSSIKHDFPGGSFSGAVLIGESHAAIHTWRERNRAWVELATCGDPSALQMFEQRCYDKFTLNL